MISLFAADGTRLPVTYNGIVLNDPADDDADRIELNVVATRTQFDYLSEPIQTAGAGMELYDHRKVSRIITLDGVLRASGEARMFDRMAALNWSFDPSAISREYAGLFGMLPMYFSTRTENTATYPSGLIPCLYVMRPLGMPDFPISEYTGESVPFKIALIQTDPRRFLQSTVTTALPAVITTPGDDRSWPVITLTMAGAGNAAFTITRVRTTLDGTVKTEALVMNLTTMTAGQVLTINMKTHSVTNAAGTDKVGLVTLPGTTWWDIGPTPNTITITNGTNVTASLTYRPAFSG